MATNGYILVNMKMQLKKARFCSLYCLALSIVFMLPYFHYYVAFFIIMRSYSGRELRVAIGTISTKFVKIWKILMHSRWLLCWAMDDVGKFSSRSLWNKNACASIYKTFNFQMQQIFFMRLSSTLCVSLSQISKLSKSITLS